MDEQKAIMEKLLRRRRDLHLSLQDVAEMGGLGINTLSRMECGQTSPTLQTVLCVCGILGLELELVPRRRVTDRATGKEETP